MTATLVARGLSAAHGDRPTNRRVELADGRVSSR
jgi:hypothetical protein